MNNDVVALIVFAGIGALAYGVARKSAANLGIPAIAVPAVGALVVAAIHELG